jgi:hypothetical protein
MAGLRAKARCREGALRTLPADATATLLISGQLFRGSWKDEGAGLALGGTKARICSNLSGRWGKPLPAGLGHRPSLQVSPNVPNPSLTEGSPRACS